MTPPSAVGEMKLSCFSAGLEPVGKVRCPLFKRPILHRVGDDARDSGVEMLAERHGAAQRLVGVPRQPLPHNAVVEHH